MKKKSIGELLLGKWNAKTIVGVAIGAALFAVLMVYGGIKVTTNTSLTSAYIIPAIVGALFGPLPAGLAAGIGNVLADAIGGWGFWFDWSLGNFVCGYVCGLTGLFGADVENGKFSVSHCVIYAILSCLGAGIGFGIVTPLLTVAFYSSELSITWIQAAAAIISDASVLVIIGIPLQLVLAARNRRGQNLQKED